MKRVLYKVHCYKRSTFSETLKQFKIFSLDASKFFLTISISVYICTFLQKHQETKKSYVARVSYPETMAKRCFTHSKMLSLQGLFLENKYFISKIKHKTKKDQKKFKNVHKNRITKIHIDCPSWLNTDKFQHSSPPSRHLAKQSTIYDLSIC